MVSKELSRTRADHQRRIVAKAQAKAARTPQPCRCRQDPAPVRTYGNYILPGTGHPAGPTVCPDDLEDYIFISVAGVPIAIPPGQLHSRCKVCSKADQCILIYSSTLAYKDGLSTKILKLIKISR